jgi:hypothetical protein
MIFKIFKNIFIYIYGIYKKEKTIDFETVAESPRSRPHLGSRPRPRRARAVPRLTPRR